MSNSGLISYTRISPNSSIRTAPIRKITIHYMARNFSVEVCGAGFADPNRKASSNYGIGSDGRIALYVDESRRSWCSNNWQNDNEAITIEVANDVLSPVWSISDKAYAALLDLCEDICRRNGIARLNYTGDKSGNLTQHRWFAATGCPGNWLGGKFPEIASEVNRRLGVTETVTEPEKETDAPAYVGSLDAGDVITLTDDARYITGKPVPEWVRKKTLYCRNADGNNVTFSIYKTGAITGVTSATYVRKDGQVIADKIPETDDRLVEGEKVRLAQDAKYITGKAVPKWVVKSAVYVRRIYSNGNVDISIFKIGAITGTVNQKYLIGW